ncbi:MAG: alpha-2-macroglobulin, partial [Anaerolineales bacterium]
MTAPELMSPTQPFLIVSSYVHLTFKLSATQVFVWAVDLRNGNPVVDAPITVFDPDGNPMTSGNTNEEGIFQAAIPVKPDIFGNYYTVMGDPGDDTFSLAYSNWNSGIQGYEFGIQTDYSGPHTLAYFYTDRPIYRPGQTVYFRTIVRHARNGRYTMPDIGILPINVTDGNYQPLLDLELPLSEYGSAQGQFTLSEEAVPGYYTINSPHGSVIFQVSEYRKPEIDIQIAASPNPAVSGQTITAQVEARYFFGTPAGDVPLTWTVHAIPEYFPLPGFSTGTIDYGWSYPAYAGMYNPYGKFISSGDGRTGSNGLLAIEIPTTLGEPAQRYMIEVTLQDESGFPVSNQTEVIVHPAEFYIGVRPDAWIGVAGDEISFEIKVVDWERNTAGSQDLNARFRKVTWVRSEKDEIYDYPTYTPSYTPVSSSDFHTDADGIARLAFTPNEPGAYELEIQGGEAITQITMWVAGEGQVAWPNLPNQQLTLTSDRQSYLPGDTAKILIPNPFGEGAQALVTIERGEVLRHQVLEIESNGYTLNLPLESEDAPNIYLVVTLIGAGSQGYFDFRQGFLNLEVDPVEQTLQVSLTPEPPQAGPQDEVSFTVLVTDADGRPVQGEFSLSIIDKAVLSLADPFEAGIVDAFYGTQPLGVRTGLSLAAYAHRFVDIPGGLGGGGGGDVMPPSLRESFQDTAYWNAEIITDAAGQAVISLTLPDNLTTWLASTRGLTIDTRVGESSTEIIATKDLLIRPVTPRFLVAGDHLRLTGIVHNNTENDLTVDVRLQATGFMLDDPSAATQNAAIPAGGRLPVAWWGTVESVDSVDLIFSADGAGLSDMTRPLWGDLPVLQYTAPQTFATAGTMDSGGERLEIVSLPRTFDPDGGDLRLELAPSLAAAILPGLDVLEHYPYECTEQTLSRFLPNLEAYRAVQELG